MTYALIRHRVRDFERWLPVFREHDAERARFGCTDSFVHRVEGDPNDVLVATVWPDAASFERFVKESDVRDAMARGGVEGEPQFTVLSDPVPWK